MKQRRFKTIQFVFAAVLILTGFFIWQGNRKGSNTNLACIQIYGGRLSEYELGVLESMNKDLKQANKIVSGGPKQIKFLTQDGSSMQYSYEDGVLWRNESACLPGVQAFHFEYRDQYGNLLTRCNTQLQSVETVSYVIRLGIRDKKVISTFKTRMGSTERWITALEKTTLARADRTTL